MTEGTTTRDVGCRGLEQWVPALLPDTPLHTHTHIRSESLPLTFSLLSCLSLSLSLPPSVSVFLCWFFSLFLFCSKPVLSLFPSLVFPSLVSPSRLIPSLSHSCDTSALSVCSCLSASLGSGPSVRPAPLQDATRLGTSYCPERCTAPKVSTGHARVSGCHRVPQT